MSRRIRIRHGLDIPINGEPESSVHSAPEIQHVALSGLDYPGLKAKLRVAVGDSIALGQPLFVDKRDPDVPYVSPGQGTVVAINRGERRVLQSVVVRLDDSGKQEPVFEPLSDSDIQQMDPSEAATRIQQSGLWSAFRTRPYSQVPRSDQRPRSIFVTAIDTNPLAADPQLIIRSERQAFSTGLLALSLLTGGPVFLCTGKAWDLALRAVDRLHTVEFAGPHPAGLPGTHIHHLDPVGDGRTVWHIGYQDVIAIGKLFGMGMIHTSRVLGLGGSGIAHPRHVVSRLGASINELLQGELIDEASSRVISGSVLNGHTANGSLAYLGRYHNQISVIREGGRSYRFGWLGGRKNHFTATSVTFDRLGRKQKFDFSSSQNGRFSGMLPLRVFERVMPLDILPSPLLRALMVKDTDQAQALGCLELDEEDLALCAYVCPAKTDYGFALRQNLNQIEREG
jgi:Na+-transporting NADH:ubiquinone oxidoreductase subunit A